MGVKDQGSKKLLPGGRRGFLKAAALGAAAAAGSAAFPAPAIARGRREWGLVTSWPKHFPGFGSGAELLADLITKGSNGRLTVSVYGAGELYSAREAM